jgi:hypothetical protein
MKRPIKYKTESERKEAKKQAAKRYFSSEKGKQARARYAKSDKKKQAAKIFFSTEKGKQARNRWRFSEKGKRAFNKWRTSEKGKKSVRKYNLKYLATEKGRRIHNQNSINYINKKLKEDPGFKLIHNLRIRLYSYLKSIKQKKNSSISKDIGCTKKELRIWIEKQFLPGMNWENYGKEWSVDHIKAISNFDYINMPEANHYTNLQPMWKIENIKKSNK